MEKQETCSAEGAPHAEVEEKEGKATVASLNALATTTADDESTPTHVASEAPNTLEVVLGHAHEEENDKGTDPVSELPMASLSLSTPAPPPPKASHQRSGGDAMREVRSMIVAALPLPPMPVMVSREVAGDNFVSSACCSSHDLLAHLMNIACTCATDKQNAERALVQTQLQAELFDAVDSWRRSEPDMLLVLPPIAWTYRIMGEFTRRYVQSYMPDPGRDQDVRFVPVHEIDRTHPVHIRAMEFQKAQDLLYGKCKMLTVGKKGERYARTYETMSYAELVQMSVARILDSA